MIIDLDRMTPEQERLLAERLLGRMVGKLRERSEIIVPGDGKAVKIKSRIIDTGLIGKQTHDELASAWAELDVATTAATRIAALTKIVTAQNAILVGREEG